MARLEVKGDKFYLDGEKFVLRCGAMHYFRIPKIYWQDRLLKLKECGFNCVETYVAWNAHEKVKGEFDFSGDLDLGKFLDIANSLGLYAIVRPGPYICAEWESGGLPYYLFKYGCKIRCYDEKYLVECERYIKEVLKVVTPRQIDNGGNVIMMQVENEYGSFGNDKKYLNWVKKLYLDNGVNCALFCSDGPDKLFYDGGNTDGCLEFFNFGSNVPYNMGFYDRAKITTPRVCAEFWAGWFDHWGENHHVRPKEQIVPCIEDFVKNDYGFNIYMFHGGTNFGFMNGCNYEEESGIQPTTTSYDYSAPLSEAGDRTDVYYAIRDTLIKHGVCVPNMTATDSEKRAYGIVKFNQTARLFDNLEYIGSLKQSAMPTPMEELEQAYGYVLYSTVIESGLQDATLNFEGLGDRAIVFVDGKKIGVYENRPNAQKLKISTGDKKASLDIFVESLGRVNYGAHIFDKKGMKALRVEFQYQMCWNNISLPMSDLSNLKFERLDDLESYKDAPTFFKGEFNVDRVCDTFLRLDGFTKGFVTINGFNIGRYYEIGPQKTLYVPKNLLRQGKNEIIVFDSEGVKALDAQFTDKEDLG